MNETKSNEVNVSSIPTNFSYKGWKSTTLGLVLLGYISVTALLVAGFVDMLTWKDTAFAMLALYIARDGVTKITEKWADVYIAKSTGQAPRPL